MAQLIKMGWTFLSPFFNFSSRQSPDASIELSRNVIIAHGILADFNNRDIWAKNGYSVIVLETSTGF